MEEEQELITLQQGNTLSSVEKGAVSSKLELPIDEVVEEYIGSFGFSQLLHVFLVSLAWIFDSQNTLVTIFTDAQPSEWKCKITNDSHSNFNGSFSSSSSSCMENNGGKGNPVHSVCGLAEGTWEWIGGNTSSTIAEWNLICERKFLAAIPASLFFIGSLLGSAFFGCLADKYLGRKKAVFFSCLLTSATSFLTSLSPNIWIYALLRFSNGFARSGIGICCLVLSTEAVGRKWRGQVGQCGFFFFSTGFFSLPLIAYPTRTCWRTLYKILSIFPLVYSIFLLPFVSESPRWLLVMGRSKEALDVLKKFAKFNGKKLPTNLSLANPSSGAKTGSGSGPAEAEFVSRSSNESLWNTKWAARRLILVMLAGFGIGFVYYGIQLNVENLNFNLYFSAALNAAMEIPAVFIGSVLLSCTNRRFLFSQSAYVAGISCILCIFFSSGRKESENKSGGSWRQLMIEAVGFMSSSITFDVMYIYCIELFPTNVRNLAVSFLRQALMLGASVSPLLVVVGRLSPSLSFLVFGLFSILSGVLSIWLPETKNSPLYETLKQQEEEEEKVKCFEAEAAAAAESVFELGIETKS